MSKGLVYITLKTLDSTSSYNKIFTYPFKLRFSHSGGLSSYHRSLLRSSMLLQNKRKAFSLTNTGHTASGLSSALGSTTVLISEIVTLGKGGEKYHDQNPVTL